MCPKVLDDADEVVVELWLVSNLPMLSLDRNQCGANDCNRSGSGHLLKRVLPQFPRFQNISENCGNAL